MASVVGKWLIEHSENFEEYMKAIGVAPERIPEAVKFLSDGSGMTQEFKADGDNWTVVSSTGKGDREFKFTIGQEADSITLDGRPIKVLFTIDGDSLVEKQKGDGFECTHVRKGSGDKLTMVLFTIDGDSLVEKQKGDGFACTHIRKGLGDKLTMIYADEDRFRYGHD